MGNKGVTALYYGGRGELLFLYFEEGARWKTTDVGSCQVLDANAVMVGEISQASWIGCTVGRMALGSALLDEGTPS